MIENRGSLVSGMLEDEVKGLRMRKLARCIALL